MYYNRNENLLSSTQVDYEVKNNLGKQNIDINLDENYDSSIFEVYSDKIENDINKLSYTLRYRTDEGKKVFRNYKLNGKTEINTQKKDKIKNIILSIPAIQDSETLEFISAIYYIKIYKQSGNDLLINNTISIINGIEPYKTYEEKINEESIKKNIEVPNDKNKYYIVITAVTYDKELLSFNSIFVEEKNDEKNNKWWIIILIIILVIILLIVLIIVIHCLLRKRKNKIEDNEIGILPLSNEKNLEEKINN